MYYIMNYKNFELYFMYFELIFVMFFILFNLISQYNMGIQLNFD